MLLKEILSNLTINKLKDLKVSYGIDIKKDNKKELIERLNETILNNDNLLISLMRLNSEIYHFIETIKDKKIKITKDNINYILDLCYIGVGFIDNNYFLIASDFYKIYQELRKNKLYEPFFTNMNYAYKILIFSLKFYGVIKEDFLIKIFNLNKKYASNREQMIEYFNLINQCITLFKKENDSYISLIDNNIDNILIKQQEINPYIPNLNDILEFNKYSYLNNNSLETIKKLLKMAYSIYDSEVYLRYIYNELITNDVDVLIPFIKDIFLPKNDSDVKILTNLFISLNIEVRKIAYNGHNLKELIENKGEDK